MNAEVNLKLISVLTTEKRKLYQSYHHGKETMMAPLKAIYSR